MTAKKERKSEDAGKTKAELEKELNKLHHDFDVAEESRKRWAADYANLERRIHEERETIRQRAAASTLEQLYPIFDNFYRASQHAPTVTLEELPKLSEEDYKKIFNYFSGLKMIEKQMEDVLAEAGLCRIPARGHAFDSTLHEAISYEESREVPADHIIDEVESGWLLGDKVLKPAKVRVSKG